MNLISRLALLLLFFTVLTAPIVAQRRQSTPKPQPKAAPTPAPTFDNFLPTESYVMYFEVRDAGQLLRSSALNDLLDPVMKLGGPPKEFRSLVKWLNAHAEQLMSSRLFVAMWPFRSDLPDVFVVIEFASPEEAAKFVTPLNEFLPTVLPATAPTEPGAKAEPAKPNFHLERLGSLVAVTPRPWTMKQLRSKGTKPLTEEVRFRTARNQFNSEPLFAFIDFKLIEKEEERRTKQYEEERKKTEEQAKQEQAEEKHNPDEMVTMDSLSEEEKAILENEETNNVAVLSAEPPKEVPTPDPVAMAFSSLERSLFGGEPRVPDALSLALSYEGESFDLRALLINAPGERGEAIPFWPRVITGAAMAPESPNIFPADTGLFATMSLDLPQMYAEMSQPPPPMMVGYFGKQPPNTDGESPVKTLEQKLNINLKDELLPLLGNEIAVALPMQGLNILGIGGPNAVKVQTKENASDQQAESEHGPTLAVAVKDKERLRALLPKLIDGLGFKGASSFGQTEKREDTELVSYANLFSYAFVGDFLVLSTDAATVRHVVDSYLKRETLGGDTSFKAYSRWQPRQLHGQFYISSTLMDGYRDWATLSGTRISDQMRSLFAGLSTASQPITYSLSNEGQGPLHELHLPKNLVAMLVAGLAGEANPPPVIQNERKAIGLMYTISYAQLQYKKTKGGGSCGSLEELIAAELVSKETIENSGYKFEVTVSGDKFEISAVPHEYGKTGTLSLFMDHTNILRGGDHNGASATVSDPPVN